MKTELTKSDRSFVSGLSKIKWSNRAVLVFLFLLPLSLKAQKTQFGVVFDPQITWLNSDNSSVKRDGAKLGMNVGLLVDRYFSEKYAITTGISINNYGGKLQYRDTAYVKASGGAKLLDKDSDVKYKLQNLSIPLGLKFRTNEIGYLTYYANLGINTFINVKARMDSKKNDYSNENVLKEIKLFNMGYFIGAGAEYSLGGSAALIFGLNYCKGFVDITQRGSDKITVGILSLRLGILF